MKLKPRTTYLNHNGERVSIAGKTGESFEGIPLYWSIQGDHYGEDGRFLSGARKGGIGELVRFFTAFDGGKAIAKKEIGREDWWLNIKT